jgi:hypothetical protein
LGSIIEDGGDDKYVYHLKLKGHYEETSSKAFYDIEIYDDKGVLKGQSFNIGYYNRGNPTTYVPNYIIFPASFSERNMTPSVFDDISIVNVPEPATILLLGFGMISLRTKRTGPFGSKMS